MSKAWDRWQEIKDLPPHIGTPVDGEFMYFVVDDQLYKIKIEEAQ